LQRRCTALAAFALLIAGVVGSVTSASAGDPDALWKIVHTECVPAAAEGKVPPLPCDDVDVSEGLERGHVLLKDRVGVAQYLLIPTARLTGIEDPRLLAPGAPDYFAAAWAARDLVSRRLPRPLTRAETSLALNSPQARSQNELHIHIDCVSADVRDAVKAHADEVAAEWAEFPVPLAGRTWRAMRVVGATLSGQDPVRLLAAAPGSDMGRASIAAVGATFAHGGDGFVLFAAFSGEGMFQGASAEMLQDHSCAMAWR
jgi:CDP-diacylglycerol pyrophosphatase